MCTLRAHLNHSVWASSSLLGGPGICRQDDDLHGLPELLAEVEKLCETDFSKRSHRSRGRYARETMAAFVERLQQVKYGGYTELAAMQQWQSQTADREPADTNGVVDGVSGFERYRFRIDSESESEEETGNIRESKRSRNQEDDPVDASAFLAGKLKFSYGDAV